MSRQLPPTWRGMLPLLLDAYRNHPDERMRTAARQELERMAELADEAVDDLKPDGGPKPGAAQLERG